MNYGIDLINEQQSDVILFGDIVNNKADELLPWKEAFGRLSAKEAFETTIMGIVSTGKQRQIKRRFTAAF